MPKLALRINSSGLTNHRAPAQQQALNFVLSFCITIYAVLASTYDFKQIPMLLPKSEELKKKLKKSKNDESDINLRLHRAISWLKASEEQALNSDFRFICLWISFNSCYAVDTFFDLKNQKPLKEFESLTSFLERLVACDHEKRVYSLLWNRYSSEIRIILENEFLFRPFWDFHRGHKVDYVAQLNKSIVESHAFLAKGDVVGVLSIVLERLYVLRNQIFHDGSTYKGKVNRRQIKDASLVLSRLLPVIIDLMIDNKEKAWGVSFYPVINEGI